MTFAALRSLIPRPLRRLLRRAGTAVGILKPLPGAIAVDKVEGFGTIHVRLRSTDRKVVRQIFEERQYDLASFAQWAAVLEAYRDIVDRGQTPIVLDLGANIGAAAKWFAAQLPAAHIVAVEPDAGNARMARMNTAGLPVTLLEAAIGSGPGSVRVSGRSAWAKRTTRDTEGEVPIVTIREALAAAPAGELLIAKIDIEGFESDLFAADTGWIDDAAVILIEPHDWMLPGQRTSSGFQRAMGSRDWELVISGENLVYFKPAPSSA